MKCGNKNIFLGRANRSLLAVVVVVLIISTQTLATTGSTSFTHLRARVAECIVVLDWPSPVIEIGTELVPLQEVIVGPLVIKVLANSPWAVYINSDIVSGQPREYDLVSGEYVVEGKVLMEPVEFSVEDSGPWATLTETPIVAVSNDKTGSNPELVELFFRLKSTFDDSPLPSGRVYGLRATYSVTPVY